VEGERWGSLFFERGEVSFSGSQGQPLREKTKFVSRSPIEERDPFRPGSIDEIPEALVIFAVFPVEGKKAHDEGSHLVLQEADPPCAG
jgi:hypothetical protein